MKCTTTVTATANYRFVLLVAIQNLLERPHPLPFPAMAVDIRTGHSAELLPRGLGLELFLAVPALASPGAIAHAMIPVIDERNHTPIECVVKHKINSRGCVGLGVALPQVEIVANTRITVAMALALSLHSETRPETIVADNPSPASSGSSKRAHRPPLESPPNLTLPSQSYRTLGL